MRAVGIRAVVRHRFIRLETVVQRRRSAVRQNVVRDAVAGVPPQRRQVFLDRVALRLAALGGDVAHVNLHGGRLLYRLGDAGNEQVGDYAGVEAAGPHHYHIRFANGADSHWMGARVGGGYDQALDAPAAVSQAGFAVNHAPVFEMRRQARAGGRDRDRAPAHRERARRLYQRAVETPRHVGHRRDEQVAETVSAQVAFLVEPILKQLRQQRFVVRHGEDAVSQIAGRQDGELAPQTPGAAAVVGDGHYRGQVVRPRLQPAQQRRQPGAAAYRHDAGALAGGAAAVQRVRQRPYRAVAEHQRA